MSQAAPRAHQSCYSGFTINIQGTDFSPGTIFDFDGRGRLQGARLGDDQTVAGMDFRKGTELIFDRHGEARVACLASIHTVRGLICPAGTTVTRNQHGTWVPLAHT